MCPCSFQADSWAREPLPQLNIHQAAGAGHPPLHGEARDAARAGLLGQPLCLLQAREHLPTILLL